MTLDSSYFKHNVKQKKLEKANLKLGNGNIGPIDVL